MPLNFLVFHTSEENGFTLKMIRSKPYSAETITDADDLAFLINALAQAKFLLLSLKQAIKNHW